MKNIKKYFLIFLLTLMLPSYTLAYSQNIIASGENIGMILNAKGVIIVGGYEVGNNNPMSDAKLEVGDVIVSIDGIKVSNITEMINVLSDKSNSVTIDYLRDNQTKTTTLNIYQDDTGIKTGLYVKDSVTGVGTITFIDPETNTFGALGHEIIESNTGEILDIMDGNIFNSTVTGINKSTAGDPGEKNARYYSDEILGSIYENTNKGVFGTFSGTYDENDLYKVASLSDISLGEATIKTVIDGNEVMEYSIMITQIDKDLDQETKNFTFEITDSDLLEATGGIVQGMSGSPILQGEFIIGAVTHVVVENPQKGYGILITNMLEEAEN
ncbi:MAG: SpoIVB peptidase S55 domain-containing protein [Mycoplasmatota bacterium]